MAEINMLANRHSTGRGIRHSLKVDMTPMVDLGFLLITFFIFTSSLLDPVVTPLMMPHPQGDPTPVAKSKVLTVLLGNNDQVFAYEGKWDEAVAEGRVMNTGYHLQNGIGKFIREKQNTLAATASRDDLLLVIKPMPSSRYGNFINLLDEAKINRVVRFIVVEPDDTELAYVAGRG